MGDGWSASGHRLAIHRLLSAVLVRYMGMEGGRSAIVGTYQAGLYRMGRGAERTMERETHRLVQPLAGSVGQAAMG